MWKRRRSEVTSPVEPDKLLRWLFDQYEIFFMVVVAQLGLTFVYVALTSENLRQILSLQIENSYHGNPSLVELYFWTGFTSMHGLGFYLMRCRHQAIYGVHQIAAAVSMAVAGIATMTAGVTSQPFVIFAFGEFSLAYLLVCGLDNVHHGIDGAEKKRWERLFYGHELIS